MLVHAAEESFQKGLEVLASGKCFEAQAYFNAALEIERRISDGRPQARYLSYYGLCLCLTQGPLGEARRCCRMAAKLEGFRPEIWYNLGRVLLSSGERAQAHEALVRGIRLQPGHLGLQQSLQTMGLRRKPVLPFLPRRSPINVFLGRLVSGLGAPAPRRPELAVSAR
jgi:tetratricopeptide (TPR) repeat protein